MNDTAITLYPPAPIFPRTLQELQQSGLWGVTYNNNINNVNNTVSAAHTQEKSISSPHSKRSGI